MALGYSGTPRPSRSGEVVELGSCEVPIQLPIGAEQGFKGVGGPVPTVVCGFNIAWVFNKVPTSYMGYKVINGDESDVRFFDKKGVIVGLKYKNVTGKNGAELNKFARTSGFVTVI